MTDIDVGALSEPINDKLDRDGKNADSNADLVIEYKTPTLADPSWYRLYKTGWVEQGGISQISGGQEVSLPVTMDSTNYFINLTVLFPNNGDNTVTVAVNTASTTTSSFVYVRHWSSTDGSISWEVKGMAATS